MHAFLAVRGMYHSSRGTAPSLYRHPLPLVPPPPPINASIFSVLIICRGPRQTTEITRTLRRRREGCGSFSFFFSLFPRVDRSVDRSVSRSVGRSIGLLALVHRSVVLVGGVGSISRPIGLLVDRSVCWWIDRSAERSVAGWLAR